MKDVLDLHTHTLASGHAYSTIQEMAKAASKCGMEVLGITEHAPQMPGTCQLFYFQNLGVIPRNQYGVRLLFGSELNILDFDGSVDLPESVLKNLDLCIASIHPPCFPKNSTKEQNTNAVIKALENPYVSVLGHPDDGRFELDYEKVIRAAKENQVLIELNNSSLSPHSFRKNARENILQILELCKVYQTDMLISSDAHVDADVGNHRYVFELLHEIQVPEERIVNRSAQALEKYLKRK